jgi:hypothetical protein
MNYDAFGKAAALLLLYGLLPAAGLVLLIYGIRLLQRPEAALNKIQKISGLGIELEVSLVTLIIAIGTCFLSVGAYVYLQNLQEQLKKYRDLAEAAQPISIPATLTLKLAPPGTFPHFEDLTCEIVRDDPRENQPLEINPNALLSTDVASTIPNVKRDMTVNVRCIDRNPKTRRTWLAQKVPAFNIPIALEQQSEQR